MKILAIGDFHGEFQKRWFDVINKEKVDLVISIGDYFPFLYRKIWFKHCYGKDTELWEVIGKEKYKKLVLRDLKIGEKAIKRLNSVKVPVLTVVGNVDYQRKNDVMDDKRSRNKRWKWDDQDFFSKIVGKYGNIRRLDYTYFKFGEFVFIGANGSSFPGRVKSRAYKKSREKLERLFKKFNNEKIIFVSHNVPYNTKLDLVGDKAHKRAKGRHYGSKLVRRIIDKYHPMLYIGGHIHESVGSDKLGRSLLINPGAAHEGRAAVIEISDLGKVKVKFIK